MIQEFFQWYKEWYKPLYSKMNVMIGIPNEISGLKPMPFEEKEVVILDLFEKIDQSIDAKPYLQEIVDKAKECGLTIYLYPNPRYKYITSEEYRKKITREYLIDYYSKFGFKLTTDKQFMRL